MAFYSMIPVLVNQGQSMLSRKPEVNVTDSVSVAIASEAFGDEEGKTTNSSAGINLVDRVVEQTPMSEPHYEGRDKNKEVSLETELAKLNEEHKILVLANKDLADTIKTMQLKVTEADNGRECAFKQIAGLQSELLQRESELRSAEQRMEDVAVANREREQQIDELMAQHAKQLEERCLQHESEIVKLRSVIDTEYYARQHLTNTIEAMQLDGTKACNEREHARKQILELQDEVSKMENEVMQRSEQYKKGMVAANREHMEGIRQLREQHARGMDEVVSKKDAFAKRIADQHKMEMQRQHHQHGIELTRLHSRLEASNVNYHELVSNRETIVRLRGYFSNLIEQRDERLRALRERIEELEALQSGKAPEQDIGQVGPNYYKLLGIQRNFEHIDLKNAYYAKSRLHHPDKHQNSPDQQHHEAMFKAIKYGYEVLKYPTAREHYNEWLDMGEIRLSHQNSC